jgi:NAD(P) transhydrogenase subunit alpha
MFGKNVLTLLQHLMKDGAVTIDVNDEIAGPMCVVYQGQPRT